MYTHTKIKKNGQSKETVFTNIEGVEESDESSNINDGDESSAKVKQNAAFTYKKTNDKPYGIVLNKTNVSATIRVVDCNQEAIEGARVVGTLMKSPTEKVRNVEFTHIGGKVYAANFELYNIADTEFYQKVAKEVADPLKKVCDFGGSVKDNIPKYTTDKVFKGLKKVVKKI